MKKDIRLHPARSISRGYPAWRVAGVAALLMLVFSGSGAWARDGSGVWVITDTSTANVARGTFTTPSGDSGTFTLTRNSATGYSGNAVFNTTATGIYAFNTTDAAVSGNDAFQYTLTITANNANVRLIAEVVQGAASGADSGRNSEPSKYTISSTNATSAVLATNAAVAFGPTNGFPSGGTALPTSQQVRVWSSTQAALTYNAYTLGNYPVYPTSSQTLPVNYQTFGVAGSASDYRLDVSGAPANTATVTINMAADMSGNSSNSNYGESFNEIIGFGVRTENPASLTLNKTVASRLTGDAFTVQIRNGATILASAATGAGTTATTNTVYVPIGSTITLTETSTGTLSNYFKSISCSNTAATGNTLPSGVSATPSWTLTPMATDAVTCTINNAAAVADLSIKKDDGLTTTTSGDTNTYAITINNNGPGDASGAKVTDTIGAGLNASTCSVVTGSCTAANSAACPVEGSGAGQLSMGNLTGAGVLIPTFPAGSSVTFKVSCKVQ